MAVSVDAMCKVAMSMIVILTTAYHSPKAQKVPDRVLPHMRIDS